MSELAAWLRARVPADTDLDRPTMSALAAELAREEHLWREFVRHDAGARFYQQLYRDPNLDVWLICWVEGQSTGYHDHDRSSGAVCVCEGVLLEDWFRVEEDGSTSTRRTSTACVTREPDTRRQRPCTSIPPLSGAWATMSPARAECGVWA
jgi:hypothetical protein